MILASGFLLVFVAVFLAVWFASGGSLDNLRFVLRELL